MSTSSKPQKEIPERPRKPQIAPVKGPTVEPVNPDYPNVPKPLEHPDPEKKPEIKPTLPSEFDARAPRTIFD